MGFMQEQITEKQDGWMVETRDAGTCYVPDAVVPVPDWLARGVPVELDTGPFQLLADSVQQYVEGSRILSIEAISAHYFARMSAPGYLDCTEWCAFKTLKDARDYLREYSA